MRSSLLGLSMALACSAILGVSGCSEDNEAAVSAQAAANAGKDTGSENSKPVPKDQTEYFDQQKAQQKKTFGKGSGYPGAR